MDTNIKKCFISIPVTGHEDTYVDDCIKVKDQLVERYPNVDFITPIDVTMELDRPTSFYMGKDIEQLLECDAIVSVHGWETSKGCKVERYTAEVYGLTRYFIDELLTP